MKDTFAKEHIYHNVCMCMLFQSLLSSCVNKCYFLCDDCKYTVVSFVRVGAIPHFQRSYDTGGPISGVIICMVGIRYLLILCT